MHEVEGMRFQTRWDVYQVYLSYLLQFQPRLDVFSTFKKLATAEHDFSYLRDEANGECAGQF